MSKVRVRSGTNLLFIDFYYRGVRCREQTSLTDSVANRKQVQALMNRIDKEIKQGSFDYAKTFPGSPRSKQFDPTSATELLPTTATTLPAQEKPTTPTFFEFSIVWRNEMAPQWRRLHRESIDIIFEAHLIPAFGEKPLSDISKVDLLNLRAKLAKHPGRTGKTLAPATINKVMGVLRQCLTEAIERFDLNDVLKGMKRLKARRPDVEPFSLEEVEKICSTIRADFKNYVTTRFFTGMRTGEINGLKWKYVDFEKNLILVREVFSSGKAEEDAKTESSLRDIPMLPMVKQALLHQWDQRNPTSNYVFSSREGNPIDAHNFTNRIWYPLLRFLNLTKRRPYQTRHTTATLMLASGENPEWIARLMGHVNTQMLFTVYSRFVPNLTRQDGLAFTGLVNRASTASPATDEDFSLEDIENFDESKLRELLKQRFYSGAQASVPRRSRKATHDLS